jgi:hypothetical protein
VPNLHGRSLEDLLDFVRHFFSPGVLPSVAAGVDSTEYRFSERSPFDPVFIPSLMARVLPMIRMNGDVCGLLRGVASLESAVTNLSIFPPLIGR